jgi:hypothetical protein
MEEEYMSWNRRWALFGVLGLGLGGIVVWAGDKLNHPGKADPAANDCCEVARTPEAAQQTIRIEPATGAKKEPAPVVSGVSLLPAPSSGTKATTPPPLPAEFAPPVAAPDQGAAEVMPLRKDIADKAITPAEPPLAGQPLPPVGKPSTAETGPPPKLAIPDALDGPSTAPLVDEKRVASAGAPEVPGAVTPAAFVTPASDSPPSPPTVTPLPPAPSSPESIPALSADTKTEKAPAPDSSPKDAGPAAPSIPADPLANKSAGPEPTSGSITPPISPATGNPPVPQHPAESPMNCPWGLKVELTGGRTQLEARCENDVQFRVNCQRLDLQAPHGKIEAQGEVKVTSAGLEASCDHLTIGWVDDRVVLEGRVRLKWNKEGQEAEVFADRLSVKLYGGGPSPTAPTESAKPADKPTDKPSEATGYMPKS